MVPAFDGASFGEEAASPPQLGAAWGVSPVGLEVGGSWAVVEGLGAGGVSEERWREEEPEAVGA